MMILYYLPHRKEVKIPFRTQYPFLADIQVAKFRKNKMMLRQSNVESIQLTKSIK